MLLEKGKEMTTLNKGKQREFAKMLKVTQNILIKLITESWINDTYMSDNNISFWRWSGNCGGKGWWGWHS